MEKTIWVLDADRASMLDIQRKINSFGGIRTMCIFSEAMLQKVIEKYINTEGTISTPSLIIVNYQIVRDSSHILETFKNNQHLAGVPLFFMVEENENIDKEEYYLQGAMVVLEKPLNQKMLFRIQQAAAQYELTKSYERILQKQISELAAAKEIQRLNIQLENRNNFLHRVFGRYFSDELLEILMEKQEGEFIGGSREPMAVLMADLRGFSSKSEQMELNELMDLLNYFFSSMANIITNYKGTIIELMGDGILAVFGALIKQENYAEAAIAAAIEMQNEIQNINAFCKQRNLPAVELGIGIHCGTAFVGNVGSEQIMRYNVIGRVVNECSRIESCCIGGQVFASEQTMQQLTCHATVKNKTSIEAKGIKEPLQIYEIGGLDGTYACQLQEQQKEPLYTLTQTIFFELYPITNKMISKDKLVGRVKTMNAHEAVLEILTEETTQMQPSLSVFSDVEIRSRNEAGNLIVSGVYAKILKLADREVQLHFTHLNTDFTQFQQALCFQPEAH